MQGVKLPEVVMPDIIYKDTRTKMNRQYYDLWIESKQLVKQPTLFVLPFVQLSSTLAFMFVKVDMSPSERITCIQVSQVITTQPER